MTLSSRATAAAAACCLVCALATGTIGALGIEGVRSATAAQRSLAEDELATAAVTASLGHRIDLTYAEAQAATLGPDRATRTATAQRLRNVDLPAVDASMADLRHIHDGDATDELADLAVFARQWTALRTVLNGDDLTSGGARAADAVRRTYRPLADHLAALVDREREDAEDEQHRSSAYVGRLLWGIVAAVLLTVVGFAMLARVVVRRLRSAIEPAREQVEFADMLQLAENEGEAHGLLQRHLQRLVPGSTVTVLNRNNSADRLEAVTVLPDDSPLAEPLAAAEPRACLAVRAARVHETDESSPGILECGVCGTCPGVSTCMPLNVGGEVIGSVLVNRTPRHRTGERQQIREAVAQAAPVLANLRNLAIAELRASTDSLTGLPNKRTVADTVKRMVAQASRTMSPMALLILDLDHFKGLNDRFGHQVGDQALANVGAVLRSAVRESDFAGRNGGEEFAVLLPDTDLAGALATAEKIRACIADISLPGLDVTITASIGVAVYPDHAVGPERLERLADSALFAAKRGGRNRVEVAEASVEAFAPAAPGEST